MKIACLILVCILLCSAYDWEGREYEDNNIGMVLVGERAQLPGLCKACKLVLTKVKKSMSKNNTSDEIYMKLRAACEKLGSLRSACKGFVKRYMKTLVEELYTTDGVRTICVKVKACKPKDLIYM